MFQMDYVTKSDWESQAPRYVDVPSSEYYLFEPFCDKLLTAVLN